MSGLYLARNPKPFDLNGMLAVGGVLAGAGVPQSQACAGNGYGGFAGDSGTEPLVYAAGF